jgi:hypothetical protein
MFQTRIFPISCKMNPLCIRGQGHFRNCTQERINSNGTEAEVTKRRKKIENNIFRLALPLCSAMKFQSVILAHPPHSGKVRSDLRRWITVTRSKCVCNLRFPRGTHTHTHTQRERERERERDLRFSWPVDQDTAKTDRIEPTRATNHPAGVLRPVSHGVR